MTLPKKEPEDVEAKFRIEPAFGASPRFFVAKAGRLQVRLPLYPGVPAHSAEILMKREMVRRLFDLIDQLTPDERDYRRVS